MVPAGLIVLLAQRFWVVDVIFHHLVFSFSMLEGSHLVVVVPQLIDLAGVDRFGEHRHFVLLQVRLFRV